eukprot:TRINITY_DN32608_c0_g1_i1.p1 TRINITY_DN32608_c0_g1~~TRINITY_DN32608_c0_g1_i1.p1  ORF type:complete len:257 (+),score=42.48 TRINITY_DN32608_c0_g1_i1:170-940(+)
MTPWVQEQRAGSPPRGTANRGCATPPRRRGPVADSFCPPPAPRPATQPALLRQIELGSVPKVREELLHGGRGLCSLDNPGFQPALCCAAQSGAHPEIFRLLLLHGAHVNEEDQFGQSALGILCAAEASLHTVSLHEACPRPDAECNRDREERLIGAVKVLLASGADVQHESLSAANAKHRSQKPSRVMQLVQSYAAASAYRKVGHVVERAACMHGTACGHINVFGTDELLMRICGFLAPEGCCFWAAEPRGESRRN